MAGVDNDSPNLPQPVATAPVLLKAESGVLSVVDVERDDSTALTASQARQTPQLESASQRSPDDLLTELALGLAGRSSGNKHDDALDALLGGDELF